MITDALTFDSPRRTKDGYLAVRAKAARTGVYQYTGAEVDPNNEHGLRDQAVVNVYRRESEVFNKDSVASFLMKPVTNDHPTEAVNAANWKDHGRGVIANALRDGDHLAFDLVIMDADAIAAIDGGKRELSNGYACKLEFGDGVAPDGTAYQATQTNIRGNHIAIVDKGRAGPDCRISDGVAVCDALPDSILDLKGEKAVTTKTITFDGLPLEITDAGEAVINKLTGQLAVAQKEAKDAKAEVATLTAEKAALGKSLTDAKAVDIDKLVADRATLVETAKSLKSDIVTDGKSNSDIQREIVAAHLGDAAKDFDDAQVGAAFAVIAKDAKPTDTVQKAVIGGTVNVGDAATQETKALDAANDFNAWRNKA